MPALTRLLMRLERLDRYPAEDALIKALDDCLGDPQAPQGATNAGLVIFDQWRNSQQGGHAWEALVRWADERLTNWHSLKVNALDSAFRADPTLQDHQGMVRQILTNLRQGINDDPSLLADAHFLQALARAGHPLAFTVAVEDLRSENVQLPGDRNQLQQLCRIVFHAFKYLIPTDQQAG